MLNRIPDYKLPYVMGYLQGLIANEALDDLFRPRATQEAVQIIDK